MDETSGPWDDDIMLEDGLEEKYLPEIKDEILGGLDWERTLWKRKNKDYEFCAKPSNIWEIKQEEMEKIYETSTKLTFGLPELDKIVQLFGPKLVTIIARSEFGKTSFMAQMVRSQVQEGKVPLVFSCEEAGELFQSRVTADVYGVDKDKLSNCFIDDRSNITLNSIIAAYYRLEEIGIKPDIIYIDQLNKVKKDNFSGSKHERIVEIAEDLQGVVKLLQIPLVVLHQANRSAEECKGFMTQNQVSDADAVFNDSQLVLFIESKEFFEWNKGLKNDNKKIFEYFINIGKNRTRGGIKTAVPCYFDRETGIFIPYDREIINDYRLKKVGVR